MASRRPKQEIGTYIGVISDTHGLLRPEAVDALAGSHLILHAGDIGKPEVLQGLAAIAPTIAVRGNNDKDTWAKTIPDQETVEIAGVSIHLLHILQELAFDPKEKGVRVVITGHSHKPSIEEQDGVLFLNPGSAGPRRFKLPIAIAQLRLNGTSVDAKIVELEV
ncbi:MAG TPA: metallophosphoesterase family protein [Leptolyngbyaceae cyanobacterium M33_DOE_097]|uniref:Phosphoesterase n=1 Tax=Oscillatoriales cyanobacterium SpSt-418 TaxID=2282169 RepID=A0A7C3PKM4_9CYAN|nr:metallophosphoesterase family protein [Leptolyngbyaceae cyanobacterium M33_DOE_097]